MSIEAIKYVMCPSYLIEYVWDDIEQYVANAADRSMGECSADTVKHDLMTEEQQLLLVLIGPKIIAVITIQDKLYPTGLRALFVNIVGGVKMALWGAEAIAIVKRIAKDRGAEQVKSSWARKGWARAIGKLDSSGNWDFVYSIVKCDMGN